MHANPLVDGVRIEPTPGPATLVIFGASGDLTRRKLLPALYQLSRGNRLPARFGVMGVGRTPMNDEAFRAQFCETLREVAGVDAARDEIAESLAARLSYVAGDSGDPALYATLADRLSGLDGAGGVLYYLAIPPSVYASVVEGLGQAGLSRPAGPGWRRLIVEKPFGTDLSSARALNRLIHRHFDESQIFRIDHYLGKETVQNLLVFRFANGMFEPIWNRRYIDHVQITAAETVGVEGRASYYEGAGALRDMVQNHLMQLLALVAMEPPTAFTAEAVRDRKLDALAAMQPLVDEPDPDRMPAALIHGDRRSAPANRRTPAPGVVRAQYGDGWVAGAEVVGYRRERGVDPASVTETYAALRCRLDSWRWAGVPFYIRTGKRLPKRTTEIAIQFRRPPLEIFRRVTPSPVASDLLIVNVQPDEGITLRFEAKVPGTRMLAPVMMTFRYGTAFGGEVPEAYQTLLLDALIGDQTLFARHDFVELSWELIAPVHEIWSADRAPTIPVYEAGEWGPSEADALMAADGRRWRTL